MSKKTPSEGKIFNLKPEMTLAMKLAATFAITYYGLLFVYEIITVIYSRYYIDSYYFNQGETVQGKHEFFVQNIQLLLSALLIFSLILIFRKKAWGKAIFVGASLLLIAFQLIVTGFVPWMKYALEVLMVLIIAPLRVKKKIRIKDGKLALEEIAEEQPIHEEKEETTQQKEEPEA